jgi:hypothetical protein
MKDSRAMRLLSVGINGFRRFGDETLLRIRGGTLAVLGHNESGKTSLLQALAHFSKDGFAAATEFTDRQPRSSADTVLTARFEIEDADVRAVTSALEGRSWTGGLESGTHWEHYKKAEGSFLLQNLREHIGRDPVPRETLAERLGDLLAFGLAEISLSAIDDNRQKQILDAMQSAEQALVGRTEEELPDEGRDKLTALVAELDAWASNLPEPDQALEQLRDQARELESEERKARPSLIAAQTLGARRPRFLLFNAGARALPTFTPYSEAPTQGLVNLLAVAETDFTSLASLAGSDGARETLAEEERRVNLRLEQVFGSWHQRKVSPAVKVLATGIEIVGRDRAAPILDPPMDQRGEGMRMFAALVAFLHAEDGASASAPVLLVDEAEMHLHYDGQADLVRLFDDQTLAQCVIYTTHSIGCLPEDLGLGVVVVEETGSERSRISQSFWTGGPGLTPLMTALGATVHSFTPARRVLIGEGAHEAILLPTLLRQAGDLTALGFQIVGGLAEISTKTAARLDEDAGTVVYLVDNDEAGRKIAATLPAHVRDRERVLVLGEGSDATCIEDFVAASVLVRAIDTVLSADGLHEIGLDADDVPATGRAHWLEERLEEGDGPKARTRVAQAAVLAAWSDGLVEASRVEELRRLLASVRAVFPTAA